MKYINVEIDEELHRKIKIESAQRGISITKYVVDCLGSIGSTKGVVPEKKPQKDIIPDSIAAPFKDSNWNLGTGEGGQLNEYNPQPKKGKK